MIAFPRPWLFWVFICYGSLIVAFFAERKRLCTLVLAFLSLAIVSVPLVQHYIAISRPLCFDFISVGQGDSTLITKGAHVILIDAGPSQAGFDTGRYVVAPHLLRRGITALDLVIVTHMHPDHAGGIPYILERLPSKGSGSTQPIAEIPALTMWTGSQGEKGCDHKGSRPRRKTLSGGHVHSCVGAYQALASR